MFTGMKPVNYEYRFAEMFIMYRPAPFCVIAEVYRLVIFTESAPTSRKPKMIAE
ncbi:MAG: hypothetical protein NTW55_02680 [Planctomycetota bacterium]|nr:hypothetical protein [Planctomycetota bacterium]